jgi:DNA-binding transcriptional regulator/RsmH inhibitor MraZ
MSSHLIAKEVAMSGDFYGTHTGSVYKQKWIVIPAAFKKKFSPNAKQQVVLVCGPDQNIVIYPLDSWQEKKKKILNSGAEAKQLYKFMLLDCSESVIEKETGRIKVDDSLLSFANISDKVIIKGEGPFITVWDPDVHQAYKAKMVEKFKSSFDITDYLV